MAHGSMHDCFQCTQPLNPAGLVQPTVSIPKLATLVRGLRNPTDTLAVGPALYMTSCVARRPAQPFIYSRPRSICPPLVYPTHMFRSRDRLCKLDQSRRSFSQNVHINSKRKKTFIC